MDKQEDSTIPWRSLSQNVLEMEGKYERRHRRLTVEFSHGPSTVLLGTHVSVSLDQKTIIHAETIG